MNTNCRSLFLAATVCASLAGAHAAPAGARTSGTDQFMSKSAPTTGFLKRRTDQPPLIGPSDRVFDRVCAAAEGSLRQLSCPVKLTEQTTSRNFLPPAQIAADLPHLRLVVFINRVENKAVSGGGTDSDWFVWKTESAAAPNQHPFGVVGLPLDLAPGETWQLPIGQSIYTATVANGCSPTTVIDVKKTTSVQREGIGNIAEVTLSDSTTGHGHYTVHYSVRAVDGNAASDFIFDGYAVAYCTAIL